MAEFAAAALTAVTSAFTSATATAATAAAAMETGLAATVVNGAGIANAGGGLVSALQAGASYVGSALQGAAGLVGAMSALRSGDQEARMMQMKADDARFDANTEKVNAMNRQAGLRTELVKALGERDAATAASGTDMSFGTPAVARDQAIEDANRVFETDQANTDMRVSRLRERANMYVMMGEESKRAARAKAFGLGAMSVGGMLKRG